MKTYLRIEVDYIDDIHAHPSKAAAIASYHRHAVALARYGQRIEAVLHSANSKGDWNEYPDFVLSLGPRNGVKVERA